MRRELLSATALGSAAFALVWSGQAGAQPAPVYDWSGTYLGVSVGTNAPAGGGSYDYPQTTTTDINFVGTAPKRQTFSSYDDLPTGFTASSGVIGTVTGGFNRQVGNIVWGLEGDASYFGGLSSTTFNGDLISDVPFETQTSSGGVQALFTFRPRVGVAIDRLLLFGTGGLAVGESHLMTALHLGNTDTGKGIDSADWSGSHSAWNAGYVVGGGAEYAISNKVSLKFEALYYNLGSIGVQATGSGQGNSLAPGPLTATPYTATMDLQGTVGRVGLTFHLN